MATPSDVPPSFIDAKPQTPDSENITPSIDDQLVSKAKVVKERSPASVFVNSEPIRKDQVQNAVKFLSHPKVKGSPVIYRRSFLEKKGLTKEEIDEAFLSVPDPSPAVATTQPVVTNPDAQIKSSSIVQRQPPAQVLQSITGVPETSISKQGLLTRFHWFHALFAVGFLVVSGAGTAVLFKNAIVPRLKSWIRAAVLEEEEKEAGMQKKNIEKPSIEEDAAAAAKAAAIAASDLARASQEMLMVKSEEKIFLQELIGMLNLQVSEMKSMSTAIKRLEEGQSVSRRSIAVERQDNQRISRTTSRQSYANGKANIDSQSTRSLSPPAYVEPSVVAQSKSYTEIMDLIQNGENPFNIRDTNDYPSYLNQEVSNPRSVQRPKPQEVFQTHNGSTNEFKAQESIKSSSYEFSDKQLNADDALPRWQQKNARITEIEPENVQKFRSPNVSSNERPVQRSWVPPQPPPVVMPEAAAAIRQPKKQPFLKEQSTDDQLLSRSQEATDELQRITKISESGGFPEANSENSGLYSAEIQNEENGSYL